MIDAQWLLRRAAFMAGSYDRNAQGDTLFNGTDTFHLCGLIERAASFPKSGATHRKRVGAEHVEDAKAAFCRAHRVLHPLLWEWVNKPTPDMAGKALNAAADTAGGSS